MGACLSTPAADAAATSGKAPSHHRQQQQRNGKKTGRCAHDSVCSVEEDTDAVQDASTGTSSRQQQKRRANGKSSGSSKGRRPVAIDMATGQPIPDFSVAGHFDVLHELGSGGSGVTYLCRDLATHQLVAVKFVARPLPRAAIPFMMGEVDLQAQLGEGHANIVTMRELLLTRTHLGLVMDYASGGSLTEQVSVLWESALQRGGMFMTEPEAAYYLKQFCSALVYLHSSRVAHRDLKLDNTLLADRAGGRPPWVLICDFGFAKQWSGEADNMKTAIGTPCYMSPQMLAAKQCASGYSGRAADVWAMGVLLFVMLLGDFPADHDPAHDPNSRKASDEVWLRQQAKGGWRAHPRAASALKRGTLSPAACDLLDGLLCYNEAKRLTAAQALAHPWLAQTALSPEHQAARDELEAVQAATTQELATKRDPHVLRLRKQAMLGMLAIASKAPCAHGLYPRHDSMSPSPSSALSTVASGISSAAAFAAVTSTSTSAAASAGASGALPVAAAAPGASDGAAAAAAAGPDEKISPAAAAAAAGLAAAAPSGPQQLSSAASAALESEGPTHHLSFEAGEGLRSTSLAERVEAHRNATAALRAARMAALAAEQQQQQPAAAGSGGGAVSPVGSATLSGDLDALPAAAAGSGAAALQSALSARSSGGSSKAPGARSKGSWVHKIKSPFAAAGGAGSQRSGSFASGGPLGGVGDDDDASDGASDVVDEVWRLPLTSTANPDAYKLSPELSVAAGALVRQMQQASGNKVEGRGRTNRSSCPVMK